MIVIMIMNKGPSSLPGGHFLIHLVAVYMKSIQMSVRLVNFVYYKWQQKDKQRNTLKYSCLNSKLPMQRRRGFAICVIREKSRFSFCGVLRLKYQNIYFMLVLFLKISPIVPQRVCTMDKTFWAFTVDLSTGTEDLFQLSLLSSVMVFQEQLCYAYLHRRASPWRKLFLIQVYRRNNR